MSRPSPYIYPGLPEKTIRQKFDAIAHSVCKEHGITLDELMMRTKKRIISIPRQEAFYLMGFWAGSHEIADYFGIDSSTVRHGIGLVKHEVKNIPEVAQRIERIREVLY